MTDEPEQEDGKTGKPDQRAAPRHRTLKQGVAAFHEQYSNLECVVRDLSETGARLKFRDPSMVPERFMLHIPVDGIQLPCERRWAKGLECGVEFVGESERSHLARLQHIDSGKDSSAAPPLPMRANRAGARPTQAADGEKIGFIEVAPEPHPFGHRKAPPKV